MKPTKSILILLSLFLTFSFSEDLRVEIIKRYDNGNKKLLVKYKGEGVDEVVVERITYNENGDIILLEKPLDKLKMEREYYENGVIKGFHHYKDGKLEGKHISYYLNGQIQLEGNYKDDERDGKWISYHGNGKIKEEGNYKDGEKDDKWIYYEDGSIKEVKNYKDGKLVK